jgi:hypothetical protein
VPRSHCAYGSHEISSEGRAASIIWPVASRYNGSGAIAGAKMRTYVAAFLIAGVIVPALLHAVARESMPWWPDTVSMGIAFGAAAIAIVRKDREDREQRRRLWSALRAIGQAIGRSWTRN